MAVHCMQLVGPERRHCAPDARQKKAGSAEPFGLAGRYRYLLIEK